MRIEDMVIPMSEESGQRILVLMQTKTIKDGKLETHGTGYWHVYGTIEEKNLPILAKLADDFPRREREIHQWD
jgi:hypothetical protein